MEGDKSRYRFRGVFQTELEGASWGVPRRLAKGVVWRADKGETRRGGKTGTGFNNVEAGNDNVLSDGLGLGLVTCVVD
jgi:hypothetical protein